MIFELTLDNTMRMIPGKRYQGDNVRESADTYKKVRKIVAKTFQLSGATNVGDFVPLDEIDWKKQVGDNAGKRDGFMQNLIEEHSRMRSSSCKGDARLCLTS